jgi:hypothetical protein
VSGAGGGEFCHDEQWTVIGNELRPPSYPLISIRIVAISVMAKAKVSFKPVRIAEGDWNILAECPGVEPVHITGFKSKTEMDEWMNGDRRIAWLRSQGYAK